MTKLVEHRAELPAVFVGLHARMTNISLPQAELKLFLDQHHKVLKDASFFMVSNNRGTLDLVQGLHTATAKMFSNIEPLMPGTENNHEGHAHQRDSFEKRHTFNCNAILDLLLLASSDTLLVSTASLGYSKAALALQKRGPLRWRLLGAGLLIKDYVAGGTLYVQQLQQLLSLMCLDQSGPTPVGQNIYAAFIEPILDGLSVSMASQSCSRQIACCAR